MNQMFGLKYGREEKVYILKIEDTKGPTLSQYSSPIFVMEFDYK